MGFENLVGGIFGRSGKWNLIYSEKLEMMEFLEKREVKEFANKKWILWKLTLIYSLFLTRRKQIFQ